MSPFDSKKATTFYGKLTLALPLLLVTSCDRIYTHPPGFCSKPSCAQCPLCQAVCTATLEGSLIFYRCGSEACDWTSQECQVVVQLQVDDSAALGRLEWARAMEDLGTALQSRRASPERLSEPWKKLAQAWETRTADRNGGRRNLLPLSSYARATDDNGPEEGAWSVEALEASLKERKRSPLEENYETKLQLPLARISLLSSNDETTTPAGLDASLKEVSPVALQLQALNRPNSLLTQADLLPLPIPLRPRQSRRCRAELAEGRPGILLKPKLNPVEGDSSLRSGHGQWYKKVGPLLVRLLVNNLNPHRVPFQFPTQKLPRGTGLVGHPGHAPGTPNGLRHHTGTVGFFTQGDQSDAGTGSSTLWVFHLRRGDKLGGRRWPARDLFEGPCRG